jgi:DNA topoisomerase-1
MLKTRDQATSQTADRIANPFVAAMAEDAREAGLYYSNDQKPGIRRTMRRGKPIYFQPNGSRVSDATTLVRLKRLAIPPAWTDVWISPRENGHIQAVGRDARGRKQYRYHANWRRQRDDNKFGRMIAFAHALPKIRRRVARDLRRRGMPREKILATVVALLETTLIRIGNDDYARQNGSFGLTTLHNRHARVKGPIIRFTFKGKSGKRHEITVEDPHLARVVKRCQDLPGQDLFGYEDETGTPRDVSSQDVNAYLRDIAGAEFTAKDFRTWAGTILTATALREFPPVSSQRAAKKNITSAIESVACLLGNTPSVCRKCYVHPEILDAYITGNTAGSLRKGSHGPENIPGLRADENAVLSLLQRLSRKAIPQQMKQRLRKPRGPIRRRSSVQ